MSENQSGRWRNPLTALWIAVFGILVGVPVRTFQLAHVIDSETGFWMEDSNGSMWILYGLGIVIVIASFVFLKPDREPKPCGVSGGRFTDLGVTGTLLTLAFLYDGIASVVRAASLMLALNPYDPYYAANLMSTGALAKILQGIFALLSAVYTGFLSADFFTGKKWHEKTFLSVFSLMPILWGIARLLSLFVKPIKYLNVSQLFLELVFLFFALITMFALARIFSDVGSENSSKVLYGFGIPAIFFGAVSSVSPFVLVVSGKSRLLSAEYPMEYVDLFFTVFLITLLIRRLFGRTADEEEKTTVKRRRNRKKVKPIDRTSAVQK